jgi:hypothetical protein
MPTKNRRTADDFRRNIEAKKAAEAAAAAGNASAEAPAKPMAATSRASRTITRAHNTPGLPEIPRDLEDVVELGRETLSRTRRTYAVWVVIAAGLKVLADLAAGGGKSKFRRLREREGYGELKAARVSRLLAQHERRVEIDAWRAGLTEKQRDNWASPEAIYQRSPLFKPAPKDGPPADTDEAPDADPAADEAPASYASIAPAIGRMSNLAPITPPLPDYPDRIITYIDLLGFSPDVQMIEERPGLLLSIDAVLSAIVRCKRDLDAQRETGNLRYDARLTQISDTLVLSYRIERGAFSKAIAHAAFLGNVCVRRGYLARGVITMGKLVHDADRMYGSGLIAAYNAERKRVIDPRIAIDARVMEGFRAEFARDGQIGGAVAFVRNRGTGDFVHLLGPDWPFLKDMSAKGEDGVPKMFDELRQMLPIRYSNAENDAQRSKIEWMAAYVNETIAEQNLPSEWNVLLPEHLERSQWELSDDRGRDDADGKTSFG